MISWKENPHHQRHLLNHSSHWLSIMTQACAITNLPYSKEERLLKSIRQLMVLSIFELVPSNLWRLSIFHESCCPPELIYFNTKVINCQTAMVLTEWAMPFISDPLIFLSNEYNFWSSPSAWSWGFSGGKTQLQALLLTVYVRSTTDGTVSREWTSFLKKNKTSMTSKLI